MKLAGASALTRIAQNPECGWQVVMVRSGLNEPKFYQALTGESYPKEYGERNSAVQLRSWFRFTHTGETGGIPGQIIGLIACVGGAFLVWTGFSLAFRRLGNWLRRRRNVAEAI